MPQPLRPPALPVLLLALALLGGCDSANRTLFEACVIATACDVRAYPRVENCVENYQNLMVPQGLGPVYDAIYACVAEADGCAGVKRCFGVTATCDSGYTAKCEGGKAVFCDLMDKTTFTYDCAAAGLSCQLDKNYSFSASCSGSAGGGELSTTLSCDGVLCQQTGEACTGDEFSRCSGDDLQSCVGKQWVTFSCSALGLGPCYNTGTINTCAPFPG